MPARRNRPGKYGADLPHLTDHEVNFAKRLASHERQFPYEAILVEAPMVFLARGLVRKGYLEGETTSVGGDASYRATHRFRMQFVLPGIVDADER